MRSDADVFDQVTALQGSRIQESTVPKEVWDHTFGYFGGLANTLIADAMKLVPGLPHIYFAFVRNPNVNAFAFKEDGRYFIGMHSGTIYMLQLIFSRMLSDQRLFEFVGNPALEQSGLPPFSYTTDAEEMYKTGIRPTLPKSVERCLYVRDVLHWAFFFLMGHELAHITLGHVDYLKSKTGTPVFSELPWNLPASENDLERQAIEAQADQRSVMSAIPSLKLIHEARQAERPSPANLRRSVPDLLFDWSFALNALFRMFGDVEVKIDDVSTTNYPPIPLRRFITVLFADIWTTFIWKPSEDKATTLKALKDGAVYAESAFMTIAHQSHGAKGLEVFGPTGLEYVRQIAEYVECNLATKLAAHAYEQPRFVISSTGVTEL